MRAGELGPARNRAMPAGRSSGHFARSSRHALASERGVSVRSSRTSGTESDTWRAAIAIVGPVAVAGVDLTTSSGSADLDRAALHDIRDWRYEPMPGPDTLRTCAPLTLRYMP